MTPSQIAWIKKTSGPAHAGLTTSERLAKGLGTPEDLAWAAEQRRLTAEWKASPAGQKFASELAAKQYKPEGTK